MLILLFRHWCVFATNTLRTQWMLHQCQKTEDSIVKMYRSLDMSYWQWMGDCLFDFILSLFWTVKIIELIINQVYVKTKLHSGIHMHSAVRNTWQWHHGLNVNVWSKYDRNTGFCKYKVQKICNYSSWVILKLKNGYDILPFWLCD